MTDNSIGREKDDLFGEALRYLGGQGWPTHATDREIAEIVFGAWLQETDGEWANGGSRDRGRLHEALLSAFITKYGEQAGAPRVVVFASLLEIRARREGHLGRIPVS